MSSSTNSLTVHPTAIVAPSAIIGKGTTIGPYTIISENVVIGENNFIAPHVVIEGYTIIGNNNKFFQFSSIGSQPQDLKFSGEKSTLEIGDSNVFREYVTIQPGTKGGGMITKVGSNNLFMANSHVGHDTIVGNYNILANSVGLSGHVTIEDRVIIGGLSGIHQFTRLGTLSFIGGGAMVTLDVPPFCVAQGDRAELAGLNQVGMGRAGFSPEEIKAIRKAYRMIFIRPGTMKEKIENVKSELGDIKGISTLLDFISATERGVCHHRGRNEGKKGTDGDATNSE